jgi:hypothetical protein
MVGDELVHRRAPRTSFASQTMVQFWPVVDEPVTAVVSILDFSPFGIGFVCDVPFIRGQQFTMELTPASGPATQLLYGVAYCQPLADGQYRVGGEFTCVVNCAAPSEESPSEPEKARDRIRRAILA